MPKLSLSPLRLLLLALLGTFIILGAGIWAVTALWEPRPLEAFLPADRTVALFSHMRRDDVLTFAPLYPALTTLPEFSGALDIGLLAQPGGQTAWVLSSPVKTLALPSTNIRVGYQGLLASDAHLATILNDGANRLRSATVFAALTRSLSPGDTSVYLPMQPSDAAAMLPQLIRPLLSASGAVVLDRHDGTVTLRVYGAGPRLAFAPLARGMPSMMPVPDLGLALSNAPAMLTATLGGVAGNEQIIQRGIVAKAATDLLGGDWSFQFDLLPLLQNESSFAWRPAASGSGAAAFALRGSMRDASDLRTRLTAFHDRLRLQLTGSRMTAHTLTHGFASAVLESDPSQVEDKTSVQNGWTVRETRERAGTTQLLSAVRGNDYVLATDSQWFAQAIGAAPPLLMQDSPVAMGLLSPALFASLTAQEWNLPGWAWLRSAFPAEKPLLWGLQSDGQVLSLSLTLPQL